MLLSEFVLMGLPVRDCVVDHQLNDNPVAGSIPARAHYFQPCVGVMPCAGLLRGGRHV